MTNNEQRTPDDKPTTMRQHGEPWPDSNAEAILRLNGRLGSLKEDVSALSDRLNAWKAISGDLLDRIKAVERRLEAKPPAPPTDPYEMEIAQAISKQSPKRSPSPKAFACARKLMDSRLFYTRSYDNPDVWIDKVAAILESFYDSSDYGRTHSGPQDGDPDA